MCQQTAQREVAASKTAHTHIQTHWTAHIYAIIAVNELLHIYFVLSNKFCTILVLPLKLRIRGLCGFTYVLKNATVKPD